jgi:hypothetical protein
MSDAAECMARIFCLFILFYLENCEIENVVNYFQQVKGGSLRSETLIVGAWYSMEPDLVLSLCQRLPSPWRKLHNDYIIFYRIHFQSLADCGGWLSQAHGMIKSIFTTAWKSEFFAEEAKS